MRPIDVFVQWVHHMMDAHWRRRSLALRKKQNIAAAKAAGKAENCGMCDDGFPCLCPKGRHRP